MSEVQLRLPAKLIPVFSGDARYRGAYGGRGSAKTRTFAKMTAVRGYMLAEAGERGTLLCGREYMNSLADSSMEEVKRAILSEPWLASYYDIGEKYIRTKNRRIDYTFAGLRHNLDSLKSRANIHILWADEGENVSAIAWQKIIPTVRENNSEIWVTWNPEQKGSATDVRFRKQPPDNSKIVQLNYNDNPFFPDVLEQERQNDLKRLDPRTYAWIWEGEYLENSAAQILADKVVIDEFVPSADWDGPYQGLDWGFSQDPTAAVKCWINGDQLFVEYEAGKTGLELDDTVKYIEARIPGFSRNAIRADSARPESIRHVQSRGFPRIVAATKGPGSIEDGIAFLRSFRNIVIHTRCVETRKESRLYSYKVDRRSGDVLSEIVDAHNNYIDAIRYAVEPVMKRSKFNIGSAL